MVGIDAITRSVHVHWGASFDACPTIHPGQQMETEDLAEWVELWVDSWGERARRGSGPDRTDVSVTVHCFSQHAAETARVHRVADAVRSALSGQLIAVRDYGMGGAPLVGRLRLREAELRELTRLDDDGLRGRLRHLVVLCRGSLEESPGD